MGGFARLLVKIIRHVQPVRPMNVLELGNGTSRVVLAACLRRGGGGRLISLEHKPQFARRTRDEISANGLDAFATVLDAPLVTMTQRATPAASGSLHIAPGVGPGACLSPAAPAQ